jgi:hypothetical protein
MVKMRLYVLGDIYKFQSDTHNMGIQPKMIDVFKYVFDYSGVHIILKYKRPSTRNTRKKECSLVVLYAIGITDDIRDLSFVLVNSMDVQDIMDLCVFTNKNYDRWLEALISCERRRACSTNIADPTPTSEDIRKINDHLFRDRVIFV